MMVELADDAQTRDRKMRFEFQKARCLPTACRCRLPGEFGTSRWQLVSYTTFASKPLQHSFGRFWLH